MKIVTGARLENTQNQNQENSFNSPYGPYADVIQASQRPHFNSKKAGLHCEKPVNFGSSSVHF